MCSWRSVIAVKEVDEIIHWTSGDSNGVVTASVMSFHGDIYKRTPSVDNDVLTNVCFKFVDSFVICFVFALIAVQIQHSHSKLCLLGSWKHSFFISGRVTHIWPTSTWQHWRNLKLTIRGTFLVPWSATLRRRFVPVAALESQSLSDHVCFASNELENVEFSGNICSDIVAHESNCAWYAVHSFTSISSDILFIVRTVKLYVNCLFHITKIVRWETCFR